MSGGEDKSNRRCNEVFSDDIRAVIKLLYVNLVFKSNFISNKESSDKQFCNEVGEDYATIGKKLWRAFY